MRRFVVLFGLPASGKDTITVALHALDSRYTLFPKLKIGQGRTKGYRTVSQEELGWLREHGDIVQESRRYGNVYAVDRPQLTSMFDADLIPVVHVGDLAGMHLLRERVSEQNFCVALWCSRSVAAERLYRRDDGTGVDRLKAWDVAYRELAVGGRSGVFELSIDTGVVDASASAQQIIALIESNEGHTQWTF